MYKEALRPVWAEINLSNFDYNVKQIRAKIGPDREFIGVIKADAYGHGAIQCAQVLRENGVKTFAIATLQEAITLREAGAQERIICLGLTPDMYADTLVQYGITPVVCESGNAKAINDAAAAAGVFPYTPFTGELEISWSPMERTLAVAEELRAALGASSREGR